MAFACGPAPEPPNPFRNINPAWSPDGTEIVFESSRDGQAEIYLMRRDGSQVQRLTHHDAADTHPSFSPDGERIVFDSNRDGVWNVYVMNRDGSPPRRLTAGTADSTPEFARHPAWSPDGTRIAFDSDRTGEGEIFVMNADGTDVRRVTETPGSDSHAAWSPDGNTLVWGVDQDGDVDIVMRSSDPDSIGGALTVLAGGPDFEAGAKFHPGGSAIAFFSNRSGQEELYRLDLPDGPLTRLTNNSGVEYELAWSPDGEWIAYYSSADNADGSFDLYVMRADGSDPRRLTR